MIFEHSRFEIWNQSQHPYRHSLSDFFYNNGALPGVTNVEEALNYFSAVIYPKYVGTSPTPADLPTGTDTPNPGDVTPDLNDYRVVLDDGDGKQAGYRWEQRDGDVSPQWYKIYDVDWSTDGILASLMDITQDVYVFQKGKTDLDENGDPIVGIFAGQRIWGGNLTGQNLTLDANSADGTGYVQTNNTFRPVSNDTYDLGTATESFRTGYFSTSLLVNDFTISSGVISNSSGQISFDNENLLTTGNITGNNITATNGVDSLVVTFNSVTSTTGAISFDDENLNGTGSLNFLNGTFSGTLNVNSDISISTGLITSASGMISFNDENIITTGNITGAIISGSRLDIDNIRIDGNTISAIDLNGNIILAANGSGVVDVNSVMETLGQNIVGNVNITGLIDIDNINIDGNTISSTTGDVNIVSNSGSINLTGNIFSDADGTRNLGSAANRFASLFLSSNIGDGTNVFDISELMALRSTVYRDFARTSPAQNGDALFYDSVNGVWLASAPDTEISHPALGNLTVGDSGHTQFVMLAGRSGGQIIQGGTAALENLTLESTSDASKGSIILRDVLIGSADNTIDLGSSSVFFKDLYTKGQAFNFRFENVTSGALPGSSASNIGRVVYATDNTKAYIDTGTQFKVLGVSKFVSDIAFDGVSTIENVDVSSEISDARNAIIQLLDNSNDFERIIATIKATSASNVRIQTNAPLPAGSYRLIVME